MKSDKPEAAAHLSALQEALSSLPTAPAWLRNAGLRAIADCCDYTDPEALALIIGRPLTAEEHQRVTSACAVGIQHVSEVLTTEGLLPLVLPGLWPEDVPDYTEVPAKFSLAPMIAAVVHTAAAAADFAALGAPSFHEPASTETLILKVNRKAWDNIQDRCHHIALTANNQEEEP